MGILKWVEESPGQCPIRAELFKVSVDFIDLCEGRFWGGHEFNIKLNFSIYERQTLSQWTHQLLFPDGIHIYCKSIKEAKELAEIAAYRILKTLKQQLPHFKVKRNNVKNKRIKLSDAFLKRGINGVARIWFSKLANMGGWMFSLNGNDPQLLGSKYEEALEFINSGNLDFYKGA